MKIALGWKAHSGWAALVALAAGRSEPTLVERTRVELVREGEEWAKQPYHAAEDLAAPEATAMVERGIASARRHAVAAMRDAIARARAAGHEVAACAVLVGEPMPAWSVAEILAVHVRMHRAEGALFRNALARAAEECGLRLAGIPEKSLQQQAARVLGPPSGAAWKRLAAVGKAAGPPWGKDQKDAALAAMIALRGSKD